MTLSLESSNLACAVMNCSNHNRRLKILLFSRSLSLVSLGISSPHSASVSLGTGFLHGGRSFGRGRKVCFL